MSDNLANWIERKKKLEVWETLRQITKLVENIHILNNTHGKLAPSTVILDLMTENVESINATPLEDLKEWRPSEVEEAAPTQAGDIFSLGCLFYFVLSNGQHPFGKSGQRAKLIANHLYDLSRCQNVQLRNLIAKMISYDSSKRPSCTELLNHPFLWGDERIAVYLNKKSENLEENNELTKQWLETILLSTKEQSVNETRVVRSVAEILKVIKDEEELPVTLSRQFPDLLLKIFLSTDGKTQDNKKLCNETAQCPETVNNLLITNESFGEVKTNLQTIKRYHGRFGMNHVHVIKLQIVADTTLMKRIRQLTHPNLLEFFYLTENCSQTFMAFEPFNETLETWIKRFQKLVFEVVIEILCQITKGLGHYHSSKLIHGNLTADQVVIFDDGNSITAKVAKFTFDDSSATMPDDIRKLGQIYEDLLSPSEKNLMQVYSTQHLILSMKNQNDEFVPPCDAIFYHPLFWDSEDITDFILLTGEICKEPEEIEDSSMCIEYSQSTEKSDILEKLFLPTKSTPEIKITNRDLIEALSKKFNSTEMDDPETQEFIMLSIRQFPKSVVLTWLSFQKCKEIECSLDIDSFYHRIYNFPIFEPVALCGINKCRSTENNVSEVKAETSDSQTALVDTSNGVSIFEPMTTYLQKIVQPQEAMIKSYLEYCIERLKTAKVQFSKAHPVDDSGRSILHMASYSDSFCEYAKIFIKLGANVNAKDNLGLAPLHIATWHKAILIVKLLIENNATIDIPGQEDEKTPLYFAVAINSMSIVQLLWRNNADGTKVNSFGQTALHIAVANKSTDILKYLLQKKKIPVNHFDQEGNNPLCLAVWMNLVDMAKMLLEYDADPKIGTLLHFAVSNASPPMVTLLLKAGVDPNLPDSQGQTALHVAACSPGTQFRRNIVDLLIRNKVNPNATDNFGRTALHIATLSQAEDVLSRLLECPNIEVNPKDKDRKVTPLHLAAWCNSYKIAEILINNKAQIDAEDGQRETPLEYAAAVNAVNVAKLLLEAGAKAKSKRWNMRSPLHIAAAHGSIEVAELLISKGADVNAVDEFNFTPLHYAMYRKQMGFVKFLESKQANSLLSKELCPNDMLMIPNLTNSFVKTIVPLNIQLPKIINQFLDFKVTVTQELKIPIPFNTHSTSSFMEF